MRLINTRTHKLEEFFHNTPPYAILSHTWGSEEVNFQEYHLAVGPDANRHAHIQLKAGFSKIIGACLHAQSDGLDYLWCDTNCIDKSSSAELSEAINSMYAWYRDSVICYAFLADVDHSPGALVGSRWFTRGWTLQELLAPKKVVFFTRRWDILGDRKNLASTISKVTRIHIGALHDPNTVPEYSIAQRMSWAADRQTSRLEDIAYCLLGIFGVNMPLLYGEQGQAFIRLQQEIIKVSHDHSILAWDSGTNSQQVWSSALASSPSNFRRCGSIIMKRDLARHSYSLTNLGLSLRVPTIETKTPRICLIGLNCVYELRSQSNTSSDSSGSGTRRSFQIWLRVRQTRRAMYDRCTAATAKVHLEESYPIGYNPMLLDVFLDINLANFPKPATLTLGSVGKTMETASSGFRVTIGAGQMNPRSGIFSSIHTLSDFCIVSIKPRGVSTISHELVSSKNFSTIMSTAWDRYGEPSTTISTTFQDPDMRTIYSMYSDKAWSELFGKAMQGLVYNDSSLVRRVGVLHEKLRNAYGNVSRDEISGAPLILVSKKILHNLHGEKEVIVHVILGDCGEGDENGH